MTFTPSSASGRARPVRAGRRALLIATSVALVSGALLPAAGVASAAQAAPEATGHSRTPVRQYDITLLTGDVVHYVDGVGKQDTVTVDRPDGAVGGVHVQQAGDDVYVLPDEATPLLAAGKLDHAAVQCHGPRQDGLRRQEDRWHPADRHLLGEPVPFAARHPQWCQDCPPASTASTAPR